MKRIAGIIVALTVFLAGTVTASAATLDNMPYDNYSYWQEDNSKYLAGRRAMYEVSDIITGEKLSLTPFSEPADIVADAKGWLYVLDSVNSRIVVLNASCELEKVISDVGGESFKGAGGLAVSGDGAVYIADTENMRVLILKADGVSQVINCPDSQVIPSDFEFRPIRLDVDKNGYLYVLSKGSFYGALVFAPDGSTEGFFGANKVNASVGDVLDTLWTRWFMTDDQRASQIQKIPYQFSDLCTDDSGLLYTTTGALGSTSQSGQIRALGPNGINVLKNRVGRRVQNADSFNFVDEGRAKLAVGSRVQDFVSIDVKDGYIYALDQTYGKVFVYSESCELLTVFGGGVKKGTQKGTFETAAALAVTENRIYVLDTVKGNITVFTLNEYGAAVKQAAALTNSGKYTEAKPVWEQIIKQDRNNQLAYRGLARAALAEGDYRAAMDYARDGLDRGIYDQAFESVRNDFLERNIGWIVFCVIALGAAIVAAVILKKRGRLPAVNAPKVSLALRAWIHPFKHFRAVKYSAQGSLIIAAVVLALYYITRVLKDFYSGFVHSSFNAGSYNSLLTLIGTVGVVILWVICNWAISILAQGKAHIKEVFIVACYSLIPLEISSIFYLLASNVLLQKEAAVLTVVSTVCLILAGLTLCIGTMIVHEFDFFKFLWTTLITIIAMAVVIFLMFMIVILLQQFFAFIRTVFIEVAYR